MLSQLLHKKSSKESVVRGIEHLYFGHCKGSLLSNIGERSERDTLRSVQLRIADIYIIGERAKLARHSQVCSIENRGNI